MREAAEGLSVVVHNRDLALVLGLAAAQSFTRGGLTVLSVVMSIELLGRGEPGAGTLMTAVGAGAVLGSLAASLLVGTRRLGAWFLVGVTLWGLPIALVGVVPRDAVALGDQLARRRVHDRSLDPRAADVDAKYLHVFLAAWALLALWYKQPARQTRGGGWAESVGGDQVEARGARVAARG